MLHRPRQIAMRAHFQNEHVGHNDVVKTCPLCTFRATSMKSLRVHFYNRHGIDLDNPATPPAGPSSSSTLRFEAECVERSGDSSSPLQMIPPHFLAPHVEISMAPSGSDFQPHGGFSPPADLSQHPASTNGTAASPSASPQSSNSNTPSSSSAQQPSEHPRLPPPSISLIPIKQEPRDRDEGSSSQAQAQGSSNSDGNGAPQESALSLIKVSPLKSLLREEPSPRRGRTPSTLAQCLEQPPRLSSCCQCIHCGIVFPDQTLYFLHKGCHSDSNPWKCNICGEQCSNIYDFNSHLLSKTHQ
ncbi:hypothetical protein B566_EDAN003519 [Ephemera danica]|nr:hypothetical protein B566_EDAN003519 [Ephemera danica]